MKALFTSIWFPALLTVLAAFLIAIILIKTFKLMRVNQINRMSRHGVEYVFELLRIYYPKKRIFKRLKLIGANSMFNIGKNKNLIKRECDIAYVGRGGILLLTVVPDAGCYDNPKAGNWKHSLITQNGQSLTQTIVNPFDATNPHISAIETLLSAEGVYQKNIARAVILTGKNVYYTTVYREILSPGTLFSYIREFDSHSVLSLSEINRICNSLSTINGKDENADEAKPNTRESSAEDSQSSRPKPSRNI